MRTSITLTRDLFKKRLYYVRMEVPEIGLDYTIQTSDYLAQKTPFYHEMVPGEAFKHFYDSPDQLYEKMQKSQLKRQLVAILYFYTKIVKTPPYKGEKFLSGFWE